MAKRRIGSVDLNTGELLDGVKVWFGRKLVSPYGRDWMQVNQNALVEIAADRDIGGEALRVFLYLNGRLDFENLIVVPQAEVAEALSLRQPAVSRAIKLLVAKGIIVRAPQTGRVTALRLNPHYGWKGKVRNLRQARQTRLQLVEPTEPGKDKAGI
jgi:DNA-binding transcriptional ArsR family regulator